MEIRIQSNNGMATTAGVIEDGLIVGRRKATVSHVLGIEPKCA